MKYNWHIVDNEINKYIEHYLFPNLLAFIIIRCVNNNEINFYTLYNTTRNYFNIKNNSYNLIKHLTFHILINKYHIKIVQYNPIILKNIKK